MMSIPGIRDAEDFKRLILEQREKVILKKSSGGMVHKTSNEIEVLMDIKAELTAIKNILSEKKN